MERRTKARHGRRALVVLLGLLSAGACSTLGRSTDPFAEGPAAGIGQISVEVRNLNFNDANLFALRQGARIRMGSVTGKSDADFRLTWNFSLPLQFEAQLVGGRTCRVRSIIADPGDRLWIQIPSELSISPCTVGKS